MKKIALLTGIAFSFFMSTGSQAQVSINVQIGAPVVQQSWYGYDDDYYYMPDVGTYYNVQRRVYVYPDNGGWAYANRLPARYNGYTYGSGRYVRIRERAPFNRNDYYRRQYAVSYNNNYRGNNLHDYGRRDNGRHRGWDKKGRNQNYGNNGGNWNGNDGNWNNNGGDWNSGNGGGRGRGR